MGSKFDAIPAELRSRPQWVIWRFEERDGKTTKVPYQAANLSRRASSTKPATWGTFGQAVAVVDQADGIGYVFSADDPFIGIDLDKLIAPGTGIDLEKLDPAIRGAVRLLDSYTEETVSGTGLHIIVQGKLNGGRNRHGDVEIYDSGRYFVMTGKRIAGLPVTIENRQTELERVIEEFLPPKVKQDPPEPSGLVSLTDRDLLEKMFAAANGAKVRRLWDGDWSGYPSHSDADAALCSHLAFWTARDAARMNALFRQSGLMREKWERPDYCQRTIAYAISQTREAYAESGAHPLPLKVPPVHAEPMTTVVDNDGRDLETELDRLAGLSILAYERERVEAAKVLGLRAGVLDEVVKARRETDQDCGGMVLEDPEPWPESVDGAELLDELVATEKRYLSLPAGAPEAMALWSIHAHAHDATEVSPILAVTSPTPECGKTTCLTLIGAVMPRPLTASNITTAALFRAVEKWRPTLLIDEADSFLRDNEELRGVLNSGHAKAGAYVIRTVGDNHEPTVFRTWAPKAIALIGKLPATLESRSIHIELRRLPPGEKVTPLRLHQIDVLTPLQRKAARWAADHRYALRTHEPEIPSELYGRAADNWRALLSIADMAGGDWPQRARQAAVTMSASRSEQTAGILLLEDMRSLFAGHGDRMQTTTILAALNDMDDRPWPEWSRGKELSARGLGRLLSPFDIHPRTIRLSDGNTPKGYLHEQFSDSFTRYLPPLLSATPPQPGDRTEPSHSAPDTCAEGVSDRSTPNCAVESLCGGVADTEPPTTARRF